MNGGNYKGLLIYSPLASPQVIAPQTGSTFANANIGPSLDFFHQFDQLNLEWNFTKTGSFLEGYFEYDVPLLKELQLGLWTRGTWMNFAGSGSWDTSEYLVLRTNYVNYDNYIQTSATPNGTLNTRNLGGGVTASLSF